MKRFATVMICLFAVLTLCAGCTPKSVSKKQVQEDILASDSVFADYGLTITDFTETRMEHTRKEGREVVCATVSAENDFFEYRCKYTLVYILFDSGWQLQYCDGELMGTCAKTAVDPDRVKQDVQERYRETLAQYGFTEQAFGQVEVVQEKLSLEGFIPYCIYRVPFTGSNDIIRMDAQLVMGYELDHDEGWEPAGSEYGYKKTETEIEITPIAAPDGVVSQTMAQEGMESYEIHSVKDISDHRKEYHIYATDTDGSPYATKIFHYEFDCIFDEKSGWSCAGIRQKKLTDAQLQVAGTWIYDDGTGENRYEIRVEHMDLDTITLSYDILIKSVYDDEPRSVSSGGVETIPIQASAPDDETLKIVTEQNVAGPEGKGAGSYKLRFWSYCDDHEDSWESGFWINGCQLTKIS